MCLWTQRSRTVLAVTAGDPSFLRALSHAIAGIGEPDHLDRLTDAIASALPHDLVTVTRYSATEPPRFLSHRNFSDDLARQYQEVYFVYDPFGAYWRETRKPGVVPLQSFASRELKHGRYIKEFLASSVICDEVGVLLEDGGDWCLGIFLDRAKTPFRSQEIERLTQLFGVFEALHLAHRRLTGPPSAPTATAMTVSAEARDSALPPSLWPELSARERELATLILAGHPSATIAERLGITPGTVKNHRRRIYAKLDITTERELFLQFFQYGSKQ
jgi:DNA-binding CsgD family transcriptional regulator